MASRRPQFLCSNLFAALFLAAGLGGCGLSDRKAGAQDLGPELVVQPKESAVSVTPVVAADIAPGAPAPELFEEAPPLVEKPEVLPSAGPAAGASTAAVSTENGEAFSLIDPRPVAPQSQPYGPANKARILVIGDSLADGFGMYLKRRVAEQGLYATVSNRGKTSTGLARVDFYDWPAAYADFASSFAPDIVVAHFGANDMQSVTRPGGKATFGTGAWESAYRREIRRIMATTRKSGATLIWLGPAPDRGSKLNAHLRRSTAIFRAEANAAGVRFLDLRGFTGGGDGNFVTSVSLRGTQTVIRTGDGSHFNATGYYLVADRILRDIRRFAPSIFPGAVASPGQVSRDHGIVVALQ